MYTIAMDNLIQNLGSAGLTEKEAKVYIALLQLGKASAYGISSRSGLKKPTTYVVLDELIKKGLVTKIPRVKKQQYVAKSPEEFFANAEERLKQAKKALPELITMAESQKVKVQTLFYEGVKGIEEALYFRSKEMRGKELVGFYATAEDASPELMEIFNPWPKKMQEAGIQVKVITPESKDTKDFLEMDKKLGHLVKTISGDIYSSKVSLEAGDDFIRIILFKPAQALIVRSPELANSVKQIFNMVYSGGKINGK